MKRPVLGAACAVLLVGCGSLEESEPKPRLEAISAPGTDYRDTLVGTRKRLDFRLRNSDAGLPRVKPLEDISPSVNGPGLTLSHTCPASLAEGEECFLSVHYQPSAAGGLTGEIRVTSNAATVALALAGAAVVSLSPAAGVVAFDGSTDGNFGTVGRGTSKTLNYVVLNVGNAADALTVVAPDGPGWTASDDCPDSLAVGARCNVSVTFTPTVTGNSVPTPLVVRDAYNADYGGLTLAVTATGS